MVLKPEKDHGSSSKPSPKANLSRQYAVYILVKEDLRILVTEAVPSSVKSGTNIARTRICFRLRPLSFNHLPSPGGNGLTSFRRFFDAIGETEGSFESLGRFFTQGSDDGQKEAAKKRYKGV